MSHSSSPPVARRGFLARLSQATAALTAMLADPSRLEAASAFAGLSNPADPDAWIARLKGQQKVIIHVHQYFMTALVDARNMLANARDMYGVPEAQHSIAVVTHGQAIQGLFRDALWEKMALGAFYKVNDPKTGAPATRNVYRENLPLHPGLTYEQLMANRGVIMTACNMALTVISGMAAPKAGVTPDVAKKEWAANLIPGVVLVPSGVYAVNRAQESGCTYCYAG